MKNINRFCVLTKRILSHKFYVLMLILIAALTTVYKLLPAQTKSSNILVAIYFEEQNSYTDELTQKLMDENSLYSYEIYDTEQTVMNGVKSGKLECGFIVPADFFENYIAGNQKKSPIVMYTSPSSTLTSQISETLFSKILFICAKDILQLAMNIEDYNQELGTRLEKYLNSDMIFKLESPVTGEFTFKDMVYNINIPVYETTLIFIIFSGFIGLLLFEQDSERGIYIILSKKEQFFLKSLYIITAIMPVLFVGIISSGIIYGVTKSLINVLFISIITILSVLLTGLVIRKSTRLSKVLPLIAFISTIVVFVNELM